MYRQAQAHYFIFAHVAASLEEDKKRGPYNEKSCLRIHGSLDKWKFDDITPDNCIANLFSNIANFCCHFNFQFSYL
ncbi:unnamed protein product [Rhizophagus irregularis]|nr:unnamed protein product [Rhizophagus irregularis]